MSITVGQNSWVTIAEADTYLEDRMGGKDWFDLPDSEAPGETSKTSLLVSSFFWLSGAPQLQLSPSLTDSNVKNAQIEGALFLLEHYSELNERRAAVATGVENYKMSRKSEKLDINNLTIPDHILGMLVAYSVINATALLKGHYDV